MVSPIIVSYSELDTFRQCPLKHAVLYGQRWTHDKPADGPLAKGSLWHHVMEEHYNVMKAAQEVGVTRNTPEQPILNVAWEKVKPWLYDMSNMTQTPVQELIEWMYDGYVTNYGIDRQWKILGVEHQIITPLRDERGRRSRFHLKAKMDLVVFDRQMGGMWVVDHKSGQNLPTQMDLEIDDQFGLYTWAMREVGRKVVGSIHSAARTQRNKGPMTLDSRMSRTPLNRTDVELSNLALDAFRAARAAYPPASQRTPPYSAPDPRTCGWKCDIKEPHLLMRKGRKMNEVLTEYGFKIDRTRH